MQLPSAIVDREVRTTGPAKGDQKVGRNQSGFQLFQLDNTCRLRISLILSSILEINKVQPPPSATAATRVRRQRKKTLNEKGECNRDPGHCRQNYLK